LKVKYVGKQGYITFPGIGRFEKDVPCDVPDEIGKKLIRESFMKEVKTGGDLKATSFKGEDKPESKRGKK